MRMFVVHKWVTGTGAGLLTPDGSLSPDTFMRISWAAGPARCTGWWRAITWPGYWSLVGWESCRPRPCALAVNTRTVPSDQPSDQNVAKIAFRLLLRKMLQFEDWRMLFIPPRSDCVKQGTCLAAVSMWSSKRKYWSHRPCEIFTGVGCDPLWMCH